MNEVDERTCSVTPKYGALSFLRSFNPVAIALFLVPVTDACPLLVHTASGEAPKADLVPAKVTLVARTSRRCRTDQLKIALVLSNDEEGRRMTVRAREECPLR